jgi:hypothetical protein
MYGRNFVMLLYMGGSANKSYQMFRGFIASELILNWNRLEDLRDESRRAIADRSAARASCRGGTGFESRPIVRLF